MEYRPFDFLRFHADKPPILEQAMRIAVSDDSKDAPQPTAPPPKQAAKEYDFSCGSMIEDGVEPPEIILDSEEEDLPEETSY